jgi:lysyl-tRNA synthetase class 1
LSDQPTEYGVKRVLETLVKAHAWIEKYGPSEMRVELVPLAVAEKLAENVDSALTEYFRELYECLHGLTNWREEDIKNAFVAVTSKLREESSIKLFYTHFYKVLTGKESGPRAAPLLALIGRDLSLKYLSLLAKHTA